VLKNFPASLDVLGQCTPVYKDFKGWKQDISSCRTYDELPSETKNYIRAIEESTGVPVKIISVGPRRDQTIIREEIF
jgi:adenylosuccinate synthase